jgi:hypothetical protein
VQHNGGDALVRELQRSRSRVRRVWLLPARLPDDIYVIFCELVPELPLCLPWVLGQPAAALVAVMAAVQVPDLKLLRNSAPHEVLHRPFTSTFSFF